MSSLIGITVTKGGIVTDVKDTRIILSGPTASMLQAFVPAVPGRWIDLRKKPKHSGGKTKSVISAECDESTNPLVWILVLGTKAVSGPGKVCGSNKPLPVSAGAFSMELLSFLVLLIMFFTIVDPVFGKAGL